MSTRHQEGDAHARASYVTRPRGGHSCPHVVAKPAIRKENAHASSYVDTTTTTLVHAPLGPTTNRWSSSSLRCAVECRALASRSPHHLTSSSGPLAEQRARWIFAGPPAGEPGAPAGCVALMLLATARRLGVGRRRRCSPISCSRVPRPLLSASPARQPARLRDRRRPPARRRVRRPGVHRRRRGHARVAVATVVRRLFRPATSRCCDDRRPRAPDPADALYGTVARPRPARRPRSAAVLSCCRTRLVLGVDAATFAIPAPAAAAARPRAAPDRQRAQGPPPPSPTPAACCEAGRGADRLPSGAVILVAGMMNVAELVLAQQDLDARRTGSRCWCAYGCGLIAGSLLGARDNSDAAVRRRYLPLHGAARGRADGSASRPGSPSRSSPSRSPASATPVRALRPRAAPALVPSTSTAAPSDRRRRRRLHFGTALRRQHLLATTVGARATFAITAAMLLVLLTAPASPSRTADRSASPTTATSHRSRIGAVLRKVLHRIERQAWSTCTCSGTRARARSLRRRLRRTSAPPATSR